MRGDAALGLRLGLVSGLGLGCLVGEGGDGAVDDPFEAGYGDLRHDEHADDEGEGVGELDVDRGEDHPPACFGGGGG